MPHTGTFIVAFMVVGVAILAAYDIWALTAHGYEATMSAVILNVSQRHPILPFLVGLALGILAGHLFAPQYIQP